MAKSNGELLTKMSTQAEPPAVKSVADQVAEYLKRPSVQEQIEKALPKHMNADRLSRIALTTIRLTPTCRDQCERGPTPK